MTWNSGRHPYKGEYTVGLSKKGRIEAAKVNLYANGGCSLDLSGAVLVKTLLQCDGAYSIPNFSGAAKVRCRLAFFDGRHRDQIDISRQNGHVWILNRRWKRTNLPIRPSEASALCKDGCSQNNGWTMRLMSWILNHMYSERRTSWEKEMRLFTAWKCPEHSTGYNSEKTRNYSKTWDITKLLKNMRNHEITRKHEKPRNFWRDLKITKYEKN